jgi:predicted phage baseplate assembly protein
VNWFPQRDLLGSDRFARDFVVEVEEDGRSRLRFGDGTFGRLPPDVSALQATYRIGNGKSGNVGRETILHVLSTIPGLRSLRNPLAARGGVDPESLEEVRQYAPQAFRRQERAVNAEDYVAIATGHPQVQRAQASLRWTGSWHTVFLTIDRIGGHPVDARFRDELFAFFEPYRLAGYDLEINDPEFVPLDIALAICVRKGHFPADVRRAVLDVLSNRNLPGGKRGFFHPDQFTFGQPVFLSQVYTAVLAVEGVETVEATRFQRWGKSPNQELENAVIQLAALEVARLDGDPNFPENGQLTLTMKGGL